MCFAQTASYFEARARRARIPFVAEQFKDAASFYRQLASIAPTYPSRWDPRKVRRGGDRWQMRAEECRTLAEHFTDPTCREKMMRLAETYDGLAQAAG